MDCDDEERSQKMVEDQILRALASKRVSRRGKKGIKLPHNVGKR